MAPPTTLSGTGLQLPSEFAPIYKKALGLSRIVLGIILEALPPC